MSKTSGLAPVFGKCVGTTGPAMNSSECELAYLRRIRPFVLMILPLCWWFQAGCLDQKSPARIVGVVTIEKSIQVLWIKLILRTMVGGVYSQWAWMFCVDGDWNLLYWRQWMCDIEFVFILSQILCCHKNCSATALYMLSVVSIQSVVWEFWHLWWIEVSFTNE